MKIDEIGGSFALEGFHVQSVQYVYRRLVCVYHQNANYASSSLSKRWCYIFDLSLSTMV